jgi:hypothetical protein
MKFQFGWVIFTSVFVALPMRGDDAEPNYTTNPNGTPQTAPIKQGLRVFTCANSFHWFTPPIVKEMAESAGITGEQIVGVSAIGSSRAIQHWDVPLDKNEARAALRAGRVDVLTLSCMFPPDDGIEKFTGLGLMFNPHLRVLLQEFWLPSDRAQWPYPGDINQVNFDTSTIADLRRTHAPYFAMMDLYINSLNAQMGRQVVFAVPVGQAVLELREKIIAGQVPGLDRQSELFEDKIGHPSPPLKVLASYCNFAVMYRHTPIGLPVPSEMAKANHPGWDDKLNRVLQQIAWDAVTHASLSGVR